MPIRPQQVLPNPFGNFASGRRDAAQEFRDNQRFLSQQVSDALTRAIQIQTAPLRIQTLEQQLEQISFENSAQQRALRDEATRAGIAADEARQRVSTLQADELTFQQSPEQRTRTQEFEDNAEQRAADESAADIRLTNAQANGTGSFAPRPTASSTAAAQLAAFNSAIAVRDGTNTQANTVSGAPVQSAGVNTLANNAVGINQQQQALLSELTGRQSLPVGQRRSDEVVRARLASAFPDRDDAQIGALASQVNQGAFLAENPTRQFGQVETDFNRLLNTSVNGQPAVASRQSRFGEIPGRQAIDPVDFNTFSNNARDQFAVDIQNNSISQDVFDALLRSSRARFSETGF